MIIHLTDKTVMTLSGHEHDNWMGPGWGVVPEEFEAVCAEYAPWVELTVSKKGVITGVEPDAEAKAAWEAEQAAQTPEQPETPGTKYTREEMDAFLAGQMDGAGL